MNANALSACINGYHRCRLRIRLILILVAMLASDTNVLGTDYYVSTAGDNGNPGTSLDTPFATLQKAIDQTVAGDTIYIRGGTYRERVTATTGGGAPGAYLTITAYEDERPMFKGSDIVTGWEHHEGAIWKKTGWTINSQQVFCNGQYLQQIGLPHISYTSMHYTPVGSGLSDMFPGSFYHDATTTPPTLYVWLHDSGDPNEEVMEASTRKSVLSLGKIPFLHIKGLAIRHSNGSATIPGGAAVGIGQDSIIEECDVQWADFAGLLLQSRAQALRCIISNNGDVGVGGNTVEGIVVRGCVISNNNYRRFKPYWHAGGLKLIPNVSGTIEENEIFNNYGFGVWFDYCNTGNSIIIRNNILHNNSESAILMEASNNGLIYNNLVIDNRMRGIEISGSNRIHCYNNTIVGTTGYSAISMGGVPRNGCTLKNNRVFNNIISGSKCTYDLIIPMDNGGDTEDNTSDFNCIFRNSGTLTLSSSGQTYSTLETWRTATGNDLNSISVDPRFNLTTADDYSTSTMSGVVDTGAALPEVTGDIRGVPRPQGVAPDMGAYETSWFPTPPQDISAVEVQLNYISVSWSPANDNVGVDHYDVYRNGQRIAGTSECEILDDGLEYLTTYVYHVITVDSSGLESMPSNVVSVTTSPPPDLTAPSAPPKPGAMANSATEVLIFWEASSDNVGVAEYHVFRDDARIGSTGATWFSNHGLQPDTRYTYRVSALDDAGNESEPSKSKDVVTLSTYASMHLIDHGGPIEDASSGDLPVTTNFSFTVPNRVTARDVRLRFSAWHGCVTDLQVTLQSPDGTNIRLFSEIGNDGGAVVDTHFEDIMFRDDAAEAIGKSEHGWHPTTNAGPWSGMFRAQNASLNSFDGVAAQGTWKLMVTDLKHTGSGYVYSQNDNTDIVPTGQPHFGIAQGTVLVLLTTEPVYTPVEQWRLTHFGTTSASGDGADDFDFDRDGSTNLVEYGLGMDPTSSFGDDGPQGLPAPEIDPVADRLLFAMNLPNPTPADMNYEVWVSSDLDHWLKIAQKPLSGSWAALIEGCTILEGPVIEGRQIVTVSDSESMSTNPRRMMRLRFYVLP